MEAPGIVLTAAELVALTHKDARDGRREANVMGTHTTEGQTADYIRHKTPRSTKATA